LTYFQHIVDIVDAVVGNFGNMKQAVTAWQNLHNGTEIEQTQNRTFIVLPYFNVGRKLFNTTLGFTSFVEVGAGNGNGAIVANVDVSAGFFSKRTNGGATFTNYVAD